MYILKDHKSFSKAERPVYRVSTIIRLARALARTQEMVSPTLTPFERQVFEYLHGIWLMQYFGIATTNRPLATQVYYYRDCKAALQYLAIQYYAILRYHVDADRWHSVLLKGRQIQGEMDESTVRSIYRQIEHYEKLFDLKPNGFPKDEVFAVNDVNLEEFKQLRYGVHQYLFLDSLEHLQSTIIPTGSRRAEIDADFYKGHCSCISVASMRRLGRVSDDFRRLMSDNKILVAY